MVKKEKKKRQRERCKRPKPSSQSRADEWQDGEKLSLLLPSFLLLPLIFQHLVPDLEV
jgi:hypothetical protein